MGRNQNVDTTIRAAIEAGKAIIEVYNSDFGFELKSDKSPLTEADKKAHQIITDYLKETGLPILSEEGKSIGFVERKHWDLFWMVDPLDGTKEFIKKNGEFTVNIALINKGLPVMGVVYAPVPDILYVGEIQKGAYKIENVSQFYTIEKDIKELKSYAKQLPSFSERQVYSIIASRSHMNEETTRFIEKKRLQHKEIELVSKGSSLKLCMIAEGIADIYPRFAPTMEWDTAAGHAIISAAGGNVIQAVTKKELVYNKENLLNPWFIAFNSEK